MPWSRGGSTNDNDGATESQIMRSKLIIATMSVPAGCF